MAGGTRLDVHALDIDAGAGGSLTSSSWNIPVQINFTGTSAKIAEYIGQITAGNGVPSIMGSQVGSTALAANFNSGSAFTLYTTTFTGPVRISFWQAITQAATVSSTFPSLTLLYTDPGGIARSVTLVATSASNTTAVISEGVYYAYVQTGSPITITSASYASSGATPMQYALSVSAEQL